MSGGLQAVHPPPSHYLHLQGLGPDTWSKLGMGVSCEDGQQQPG